MNKRALHHMWTKLRRFNAVYFLVLSLVCFATSITALRQNNLTAIRLRDEVVRVDEQNGDIETALRNLREHVYNHMNSDLAGGTGNVQQPVQLKFRYERLLTAEKERVSKENEKIYNEAQVECERRFPAGLSGAGRVPCIEEYVSNRSVKEQVIPDALYKFDFVSPRWSPDLAGIFLLLTAIFFVLLGLQFFLVRWMKHRLAEHL